MKALTVRQPWAWAIVHGGKDIENRTWNTRFRGVIAVHAGATPQPGVSLPSWARQPAPGALVHGAIIGVVDIVDVVKKHDSPWFEGPFGFVLGNPRPLPQTLPCSGAQGLWNMPPELAEAVCRLMNPNRQGPPA